MGSNFSKEGITKDLEAMKEAGIAGATIFNISSGVMESECHMGNNPWPEQTYRSDAYWEALEHAASEAQRLGMKIGIHNSPGYATTGGPWIDNEKAMKIIVSREIKVSSFHCRHYRPCQGWKQYHRNCCKQQLGKQAYRR